MSVSVDTGGGGRGKSQNFDLNLVPFIDLLSVLITFLLVTAVWAQMMAMQIDQAISDPNAQPPPPTDTPPKPPLTVHIRADGIWAGRDIQSGTNYAKIPAPEGLGKGLTEQKEIDEQGLVYDWVKLREDLDKDLESLLTNSDGSKRTDAERTDEEKQSVIVTDDGVTYVHMIRALDMTRDLGYDKTLLGGGPAAAQALPLPTAPQ